ncbi:MAG: TonB-dependent receptor, partial [Gemmatimonadetes bacterium]|nr:TonB-dependent receptor [Gemmatimonadota bacterium]
IAFIPTGTSAPGLANGFSRRAVFDFLQLNNDINLRYQRDIFPNVQSTTRIGGTLQYEKGENFSAEGRNLSPVAEVVSSGANVVAGETRSKRVIYGGFVQQTFGIVNRLFVTAAARIDASSVYDADNRWQFYPKASASYLISDTGFWQNSALQNIFPDFKLRASIGTSGGQTAIGPYDRLTNYNASSYDGNPGLVPSTQLGGTIKPERQREIEIGTDFSLLSNRLGIELTYYDQRIDDLLLFRTLSPSTGHSRALQNVGTMDNTGLEFLVRAIPLARPNLRWESTFTYSTNKNKVDGIEGGRLIIPNSFSQVSAINGEPLGVFFSTAFERDAQGNIANDENNLPIQAADRKIIGDPNPDFTASWINQIALGQNWSFRMQWDAIIGGDVFNFTRRLAALSAFGVLTDYERELNGELPSGYNSRVFRIFEQWIEDGSFVKLRELSASYRWQPQFLGLSSIQLSLIGRNLLSIDDYSGYDPETNIAGQRTAVRGFDFVEVPIPRSIAFRISLNY